MRALLIVVAVGLGMAGVSVALGYLYVDFTHREGAWAELRFTPDLSDDERQEILEAWREIEHFETALVAGTGGVAFLGMGIAGAVLQLPFMRGRARES
ncbi:MAG: hypothetical protein AAGH64_09575 [Planctomycetota bacterium]